MKWFLSSPATPQRSLRYRIVVAGVMTIWFILACRLVHLQSSCGQRLARWGVEQKSYIERLAARPGEIVDRNGQVLAMTITRRSLYLDPSRISDPRAVADSLATVLDLDADRLAERIEARRSKRFIWVKRRLSDIEADRIGQLDLPRHVWGFRNEYRRRYPQGHLAAHVLGTRDIDGIGRGGLEQSLDPTLRGRDGVRLLVRDARGAVIEVREHPLEVPRHGATVRLTLDTVIQMYVEAELDQAVRVWKPRGACAIVIDPNNGEILAMASRPVFDPNDPHSVPENAWTNLAVAAVYEPGSTFKPFVVARALQLRTIEFSDRFDCRQGAYRMGNRVLRDSAPHGWLDVCGILAKSSNIGMATIGQRMGNAALYDTTVSFGFGQRTGVELPGELSGLVRPLELWNDYSTGSIPMGHEVAVTPIQLIVAHAALCNSGRLIKPHLVLERNETAPGPVHRVNMRDAPARVVSRVVNENIADWIVGRAMVAVVESGTGKRAAVEGYSVFAKTGTAQKLDLETGTYVSGRHVVSVVCGAPADDPRVLVVVVIDEPTTGGPHFGGTVAAPVGSRILERSLIHLRVPGRRTAKRG